MTETIAGNVEDYVAIAICLVRDTAWRDAITSKIAGNKEKLYRDRTCIEVLEEFIERAPGTITAAGFAAISAP